MAKGGAGCRASRGSHRPAARALPLAPALVGRVHSPRAGQASPGLGWAAGTGAFVWPHWAATVVKRKAGAEDASHGSAQSRPSPGGAREDPGCMRSTRLQAVLTPSKQGANTPGPAGRRGGGWHPVGPQHPPPHTALNAALRALPRPAPASPASAESSGATGKDGARIRMGTLGGPTLVRARSNRVSYIFTHGSQDASDPRTPWCVYICRPKPPAPRRPARPAALQAARWHRAPGRSCCQPRPSLPPPLTHLRAQKASCKRPRSILKLLKLINLKKCLSSFGPQGQCTWRRQSLPCGEDQSVT